MTPRLFHLQPLLREIPFKEMTRLQSAQFVISETVFALFIMLSAIAVEGILHHIKRNDGEKISATGVVSGRGNNTRAETG